MSAVVGVGLVVDLLPLPHLVVGAAGGRQGAGVGDDVGNQAQVAGLVLASGDDGLADGRMPDQGVLDLAGLDAEPAQLDLVVGAAEEADVAVREEAGAVAGAVQPVALTRAERVTDESFCGQLGPVDVADAETVPADVQVALDADGARLHVLVEHVVAGVVDGTAVGDAAPGRVDLPDPEVVGPHRRLGGAAEADDLRAREHPPDLVGQRQRGVVAGEEHQAQVVGALVPAVLREQGCDLVEGGGHRVPEGDRLREQDVEEQLRIALLDGVRDVDAAAAAEQAEDVEDGEVEAERGDAQDDVVGAERERAVTPVEQVVHRAVGDRDALRLPGAAGGEDDVRRVVRSRGRFRIVVGAGRPGVGEFGEPDAVRQGPAFGVRRGQHEGAPGVGEHAGHAVGGQRRFER